MPVTLEQFVKESNKIERLVGFQTEELEAHREFLALDRIEIGDISHFVRRVAGMGSVLRMREGLNVKIGHHIPPQGGEGLIFRLKGLLAAVNSHMVSPYEAHCRFEYLHPYMDGNGRAGRVLWLWMMGGTSELQHGFLHTFYYQTLSQKEAEYERRPGTV